MPSFVKVKSVFQVPVRFFFPRCNILKNFKLLRDIAKDSTSMQFWLEQTSLENLRTTLRRSKR